VFFKFGVAAASTAAVGVVMMGSGTAFATSTSDFVVNPRAVCDTSTGVPKAAITVTDKDASGAPADIVVRIRLADGRDVGGDLATAHIEHPTAAGVSVTLLVDWKAGYQWNVRVTGDGLDNALLSPLPISDEPTCTVPPTSPSPSATTPAGGSGGPSPSGSTSASPSPSASADAAPTTSAASEPSASATATGGPTLAESGGGSSTGLITGAAAVVLLAGAGTLVALRRRAAAGRH
jgi:hypothetical protein